MTTPRPSEWLAQNTYLVAGGLAVLCIVVVSAIALFDQLWGTERWCYRWLDAEGETHATCRDGERSCEFDRIERCERHSDGVASRCHPNDGSEPPLERCGR